MRLITPSHLLYLLLVRLPHPACGCICIELARVYWACLYFLNLYVGSLLLSKYFKFYGLVVYFPNILTCNVCTF